jgi:hypothetical protein
VKRESLNAVAIVEQHLTERLEDKVRKEPCVSKALELISLGGIGVCNSAVEHDLKEIPVCGYLRVGELDEASLAELMDKNRDGALNLLSL